MNLFSNNNNYNMNLNQQNNFNLILDYNNGKKDLNNIDQEQKS